LNPLRKKKIKTPNAAYADIFKIFLKILRGSPSLFKVLVAIKKPVVEKSPVKNKKREPRNIKI